MLDKNPFKCDIQANPPEEREIETKYQEHNPKPQSLMIMGSRVVARSVKKRGT